MSDKKDTTVTPNTDLWKRAAVDGPVKRSELGISDSKPTSGLTTLHEGVTGLSFELNQDSSKKDNK